MTSNLLEKSRFTYLQQQELIPDWWSLIIFRPKLRNWETPIVIYILHRNLELIFRISACWRIQRTISSTYNKSVAQNSITTHVQQRFTFDDIFLLEKIFEPQSRAFHVSCQPIFVIYICDAKPNSITRIPLKVIKNWPREVSFHVNPSPAKTIIVNVSRKTGEKLLNITYF